MAAEMMGKTLSPINTLHVAQQHGFTKSGEMFLGISVCCFTKVFTTLRGLVNWFNHPLVLEDGGFFDFSKHFHQTPQGGELATPWGWWNSLGFIWWWNCQRVVNFHHHHLFISQSQCGLQKVWVKLICIFVEQVSPPWGMYGVQNAAGWGIITLHSVCRWWNSLWNDLLYLTYYSQCQHFWTQSIFT